jgi:Tripartite tricarboxylate transporter family receptor
MAEAGYPDVEGSSWAAVVVPAGTPKEIIAQLQRMIAAIVVLPDVKSASMRWALSRSPIRPMSVPTSSRGKWRNGPRVKTTKLLERFRTEPSIDCAFSNCLRL